MVQTGKITAQGNPCIEVGDGIRVNTKTDLVYTYVMQRTLMVFRNCKTVILAKVKNTVPKGKWL